MPTVDPQEVEFIILKVLSILFITKYIVCLQAVSLPHWYSLLPADIDPVQMFRDFLISTLKERLPQGFF